MKEWQCVVVQLGTECDMCWSSSACDVSRLLLWLLLSYVRHRAVLAVCGWLLPEFIVSLYSPKSKQTRLSHRPQYTHHRVKQQKGMGVLHCVWPPWGRQVKNFPWLQIHLGSLTGPLRFYGIGEQRVIVCNWGSG